MTLYEKLLIFEERGWTCDPSTGQVFTPDGKVAKTKGHLGYIRCSINVNKKQWFVFGHTLVWWLTNKQCVKGLDHINGIVMDNRISNLRLVTQQENTFNSRSKGYTYQNGGWVSRICLDGKNIYLGKFKTEEEAHQCYLEAKKVYHPI